MLKVIETGFDGLLIIEPQVFGDDRGYFLESYHAAKYEEAGIKNKFIQDNESKSNYGVIRGLHFQIEPNPQAKLVRVVLGRILDVALDLRRNSKTYGKYYSIELSESNKKQFLVPRGFAHGFSVLSETAIVNYKCDALYAKEYEHGINPTDPALGIDWKIEKQSFILSEKDLKSPDFSKIDFFF